LPMSPPTITRVTPSQPMPIPHNVNLLMQQLGMPQLRVVPGQNVHQNPVIPELRQMPLRPLLAPMIMLILRTMLLLYFVAPARKPIFGILILAWMFYEIWQPIRNGLIRGWRHAVAEEQLRQNIQNGQNGQQAGQARQGQPPAEQNPQPGAQPANPGRAAAARIDDQAAVILDHLANMNIQGEEEILNQPATRLEPPTLGHKITTFISLLVTTTHPAVWNRRRAALGRREGRIRTEENARNTEPRPAENEGEVNAEETVQNETRARIRAQLSEEHARRPAWLRRYMERVVAAEWVDDSD